MKTKILIATLLLAAVAAPASAATEAQAAALGKELTPLGGERVIEELEDDPLPRIC